MASSCCCSTPTQDTTTLAPRGENLLVQDAAASGCGCGCSGHGAGGHARRAQDLPTPGSRSASDRGDQFTVTGMTCGHCASSVAKQVGALPGVRDVRVDLGSGRLTLDADQPVSRDEVAGAVRRAGYDLV